jgi:hypothetical protein
VQSLGFTEDAVLVADSAWLVRWHTSAVTLTHARCTAGMSVSAPHWAMDELIRWGRLRTAGQPRGQFP